MKPARPSMPRLFVEGKDDLYAIIGLLERHGIPMDTNRRPLELIAAKGPVSQAEGIDSLFGLMKPSIQAATEHPVGFVIDTDTSISDRWNEVCGKLKASGLNSPENCPSGGYIGKLPDYPFPVGVWMMPDCRKDHGTLEHLLHTLIPVEDPVWPLASQSTDQAKGLGAKFREVDQLKAKIHCWLAWQKTPGQPYGTAITSRFLGADSQEARAFLAWLKKLFQLDSLKLD